jgi:hypothetical protein
MSPSNETNLPSPWDRFLEELDGLLRRLAQSVALRLVRATGVKPFQVTASLGAPSRAPIAP